MVALKKALYNHLWRHLRRYFLSRAIYNPPDIEEICHYAECPNCAQKIEAQGWRVGFREENGIIREVFFVRAKGCHHWSCECFGGQHG